MIKVLNPDSNIKLVLIVKQYIMIVIHSQEDILRKVKIHIKLLEINYQMAMNGWMFYSIKEKSLRKK